MNKTDFRHHRNCLKFTSVIVKNAKEKEEIVGLYESFHFMKSHSLMDSAEGEFPCVVNCSSKFFLISKSSGKTFGAPLFREVSFEDIMENHKIN